MKNGGDRSQSISEAYLAAADRWKGCDWTTKFGQWEWNLKGMNSKQTRLLAEATSGQESNAWREATNWLEQVEQDARAAQIIALVAIECVETKQYPAALIKIKEAIELESRYREPVVWVPLCDLIAAVVYSVEVDLGQ